MNVPTLPRPKIAETVVARDAWLRDVTVGTCCEILGGTTWSMPRSAVTPTSAPIARRPIVIGKFCAIAAGVRIGPPNHPMDRPTLHRFTYCPKYCVADVERDRVPARPILLHLAERLRRIAWWDWPFELIMQRLADFQSSDVEAFCDRWDNGGSTVQS